MYFIDHHCWKNWGLFKRKFIISLRSESVVISCEDGKVLCVSLFFWFLASGTLAEVFCLFCFFVG